MSYDYSLKYIMVGDSAVGKTSILNRFLTGAYNPQNQITIGVEFGQKIINLNKAIIKLQVWDTAGQDEFKSMTRSYYRSSAAALLVFDCTRPETFNSIKRWIQDVRTNGNRYTSLVLICNKIDLVAQRRVSRQEGLKMASQHNMVYVETSARNNENIEEAFIRPAVQIIEMIDNGMINLNQKEEIGIKLDPGKRKTVQKQNNCCEC